MGNKIFKLIKTYTVAINNLHSKLLSIESKHIFFIKPLSLLILWVCSCGSIKITIRLNDPLIHVLYNPKQNLPLDSFISKIFFIHKNLQKDI